MKKLNLFHLLTSFFLLLALPSCAVVRVFQEALEQTEVIGTAVEKKMGVRPSVSYNNNNGVTEIIVVFDQLPNLKMTVLELQNVVRESVTENLAQEPRKLYITIDATKNQN